MEIPSHLFAPSMAKRVLRPPLSTPISRPQASASMYGLRAPIPGFGSIMKLSSFTPTSPN